MANFSFNSIVNKAWNGICAIIGVFFGILILGIVFASCILICYNWFLFPIWALARPKSVAEDMTEDRGKNDNLWNNFFNFVTPLLAWQIRLLPWYARKHFVATMPETFDKVDLVKYYRRAEDKAEAFKLFDGRDDAKSYLWYKMADGERDGYLTIANVWTNDMLQYAIENDLKAEIREYFKTNTPSEELAKLMLKEAETKAWVMDIFSNCIKKHGLNKCLVNDVFTNGSGNLQNAVGKALDVYAQVAIIKSLSAGYHNDQKDKDWADFCKQTPNFYPEAEKAMAYGMFAEFYKSGHRLSEDGICYHLQVCSEGSVILHAIFDEQAEDILASERAMAIMNSRDDIKKMFIRKQAK